MASEQRKEAEPLPQDQEFPTPQTFEPAEVAAPGPEVNPPTAKGQIPAKEEPKEEIPVNEVAKEDVSVKEAAQVEVASKEAPKEEVLAKEAPPEEAPDPDEDDLSDLDDVLDEFAATNISKPAPTSPGPGRPAVAAPTTAVDPFAAIPGLADDDEFAKSLQAGMAELLGEFESNPEMAKQFEELVKELGDGMTAATVDALPTAGSSSKEVAPEAVASASAKAAETAAKTDASFQETIRQTMERMNASSAAATDAAAQASNAEEDFLAAMLREMEKAGPEGLGVGSDEDFSKMLMGMMEQLTNKDILYEPMKELHDKFPPWLAANRESTKKEDLDRYEEQQKLVNEIVAKFEEAGYSDDKVEYREYIVERMQQMQAAGSPPPDLVGDMNAAQEALGGMDEGCPQQ